MMRLPAFRVFLAVAAAAGWVVPYGGAAAQPIDRHALVTRHNPVVRAAAPLGPLSLGNGAFAFTADVTGLQSFPDFYRAGDTPGLPGGIPLATQAEWGWHTFPDTAGYRLRDTFAAFDTHGRAVDYPVETETAAGQWLRRNPHRLSLAQVGFSMTHADGSPVRIDDLADVEQTLDLWSGTLTSRFSLDGAAVVVHTWVHPAADLVAARVDAPALPTGRLRVRIAFPYGSERFAGDPSDWDRPDAHTTTVLHESARQVDWQRTLDADGYYARAAWSAGGRMARRGPHAFELSFDDLDGAAFVVAFAPEPFAADPLPDAAAAEAASRAFWEAFWQRGGAVDLSETTDPRAVELERRIVLSQYLTAIQCAGTMPPQETGLTLNSWHGKFHLEMHWWHGVHFALWGRLPLLERSLGWYGRILPQARATAQRQGYDGARWPKMVGPDGRESPSTIGPLLVWQQPHPIYYAELAYRARPDRATLDRYRDVVFATAAFVASFARWDAAAGHYVLGPPLIPAQEIHPPRTTRDPTFELASWAFGLRTAQAWRERLGLPRDPQWDRVLDGLAPLPVRDGRYVNAATSPDPFADSTQRRDHPTLLAACGMLPCDGVDPATMRRTLDAVLETWDWPSTWGWDYPLVAMTAARLGAPDAAVDALLMDVRKNTYLSNGHNYQRENLPLYLPGNGALLTAVAMMAAGWDGAPDTPAPGFPTDGRWIVRWEGLERMP